MLNKDGSDMENYTRTKLADSAWSSPGVGITDSSLVNGNTTTNVANDSSLSDYYDYDYDAAVSTLPLEEVIPVSIAYSITLIVGICGNFLVIFAVCRYKRLRSITNAFLTSLASADLLLVLICVPVKCAAFFSFTWAFGAFLCKFVHYMQTVSMICSVMTLTVMSIERFVAILFPLKAKNICTSAHARVVIFITWVLAFFMAVPTVIIQTHKEVGVQRKAYWCVKEFGHPMFAILFESYMFVIIFVVPVLVMVVAYTGICLELSRMSGARVALGATHGGFSRPEDSTTPLSGSNTSGRCVVPIYRQPDRLFREHRGRRSKLDEDKSKVVQMLIVVVVLFAICWGPILINNLLVAAGVLPELHEGYLKPMRQAFFLMSYMNSCTNPVVYGFMSKNFRESFKHAIMCWCRDSYERRRQTVGYSFATRSTMVNGGSSRMAPDKVDQSSSFKSAPNAGYKYLDPKCHNFNARV